MGLQVYLDGEYFDKDQAKVSVFDHGLLYGDGVFEGIRAYHGRVFRLQQHLDRLYRSARAILLEIPLSKEEMVEAVLQTLRRNELTDAYIRLVVTRGKGDLGLDPRKCKVPTIIIITDRIELYPEAMYEKGLEVITVSTRRNSPTALCPSIKSLNYLNNIIAKIEVNQRGLLEGIMLNAQGFVAEATGDNIFMVDKDCLLTPPAHLGLLRGITRDAVIDLAENAGIPVRETVFTQNDVYNADECFLTGTAAEIMPVIKVDGRLIGKGTPGPITRRLIGAFRELAKVEGVSI